jgi:hemolysin III
VQRERDEFRPKVIPFYLLTVLSVASMACVLNSDREKSSENRVSATESNTIKDLCDEHVESPAEELASYLTHALGALLSIVGFIVLVICASIYGNVWHIVSFSIYGASLVFLYATSSIYHRCPRGPRKGALRVLDHCAIYLLIVGTYTPVLLITLREGAGWTLFYVLWGMAILGILQKLYFINHFKYLSTVLYVAMGWLALIVAKPLIAQMSPEGVRWLIAGGVAYTGGVAFFLWDSLPFNHAIWHLFVIAGSICHYFAVLWHVLPINN